jgi:hypothetical protein
MLKNLQFASLATALALIKMINQLIQIVLKEK